MSFFTRLFGSRSAVKHIYLESGDEYFEIVGESFYQQNLLKIAGEKTTNGVEHYCEAELIPELNNPHDENAVAVFISGLKVGHLSRDDAFVCRHAIGNMIGNCDAVIVGGWDRGPSRQGHFGVKLDLEWPPRPVE